MEPEHVLTVRMGYLVSEIESLEARPVASGVGVYYHVRVKGGRYGWMETKELAEVLWPKKM
jgi:hypothetical protein